jgi:Gas vesicle synthesis protein GvpO
MIADIRDKVKRFLKETVDAEGIRIVTIDRVDDGWIAEAEVAERNQYLASIRPEYRVFEKEHYIVKLDADLEIVSYKRGRIHEEAL